MSEPSPISPATLVQRRGDWLTARVGDELVMMEASTGHHIGLTETGARIWDLVETPRSFADICAMLAEEFDASDELIARDVGAFLQRLAAKQAVELSEI